MSNIEQNLQKILSSRYGKDVRQAIHDGIHDCYEDGKAGAVDLVARERIDNLVANNNPTEGNSELVDIRVDIYGKRHTSAGKSVRKQIESIFSELNDAGLIINIDVKYDANSGIYVDFNGIIRNLDNFSISNFVEIPPSITKILYRNVYVNPYVSGITFFREPILDNSQILTHIQYAGTDNTITDVGMCEIPEEAKYVVFSNNVNSAGVVQSSGIYKFIQNTPTKTSDLENDVGFITKDDLPELKNNGNTPSICIGSKLYAVVGDTLQVFYNSIIEGYSEEFILRIQCEKGKCFPRFWEYTPVSSDVGTAPLVISIYYLDGTLIEEKNVQLIIKQANNPSEVKNILCIGDSTMQGGQIPIESSRRLKGTTGVASQPEPLNLSNFKFVGRLQNLEKTVGWEGTGGWSFNTYLNKNGNAGFRFEVSDATTLNIGDVYQIDYDGGYYRFQLWEINVTEGTGNIFGGFYTTPDSDGQADSRIPQNGVMDRVSGNGQETVTYTSRVKESYMPFWNYDTNKWDIKQYVEKYCEGKVDYIVILLGINNIIGMDAFSTDFSYIINSAKTLLRNIHSQIPEAKVLLSTLAPVSVLGGIGSNYGSSGIPGQYSANGSNRKVFEYNKELFKFEEDSEFNEYVTIVSAHSQFDAYTGYPWTEKHLVTRYSDNDPKEYIQTNAVHPSNQGYWMISDALCFRPLLCIM